MIDIDWHIHTRRKLPQRSVNIPVWMNHSSCRTTELHDVD